MDCKYVIEVGGSRVGQSDDKTIATKIYQTFLQDVIGATTDGLHSVTIKELQEDGSIRVTKMSRENEQISPSLPQVMMNRAKKDNATIVKNDDEDELDIPAHLQRPQVAATLTGGEIEDDNAPGMSSYDETLSAYLGAKKQYGFRFVSEIVARVAKLKRAGGLSDLPAHLYPAFRVALKEAIEKEERPPLDEPTRLTSEEEDIIASVEALGPLTRERVRSLYSVTKRQHGFGIIKDAARKIGIEATFFSCIPSDKYKEFCISLEKTLRDNRANLTDED